MNITYQGIDLDDDFFHIDWKIGDLCNYSCSYCCQRDNMKRLFYPEKNSISNAINIFQQFKTNKLDISVAGGETTLYPDLDFLINSCLEKLKNLNRLTILTNGHKNISYFQDLFPKKNDKIFLYFSIHPEFVNDIKHLKEKIIKFSELVNLQIAIMYLNDYKTKEIVSVVDDLILSGVRFSPKLVFLREGKNFNFLWKKYKSANISFGVDQNQKWFYLQNENKKIIWKDERSRIFRDVEHNFALVNNYLNFFNMYCIHGFNTLWVDQYGYCSGAICGQAEKSKFSIYDGVNPYYIKNFLKNHRCVSKSCGCKDNLYLPKFKNRSEALFFLNNLKK